MNEYEGVVARMRDDPMGNKIGGVYKTVNVVGYDDDDDGGINLLSVRAFPRYADIHELYYKMPSLDRAQTIQHSLI